MFKLGEKPFKVGLEPAIPGRNRLVPNTTRLPIEPHAALSKVEDLIYVPRSLHADVMKTT